MRVPVDPRKLKNRRRSNAWYHANKKRERRPGLPRVARIPFLNADGVLVKVCSGVCGLPLPLDQFYAHPLGRNGLEGKCKTCFKEKQRGFRYRRTYGITIEEYEALLDSQGRACAICGSQSPDRARHAHFQIDHDHATGKVRGILCQRCNVLLANARDRPDIILRAAAYLSK